MNAPMILPWLARKWGVTDERALVLWRRACESAGVEARDCSSSEYWANANRNLIDLLDCEAIAQYPVTETPWIMIHLNILRLFVFTRLWAKKGEGRLAAVFSF